MAPVMSKDKLERMGGSYGAPWRLRWGGIPERPHSRVMRERSTKNVRDWMTRSMFLKAKYIALLVECDLILARVKVIFLINIFMVVTKT